MTYDCLLFKPFIIIFYILLFSTKYLYNSFPLYPYLYHPYFGTNFMGVMPPYGNLIPNSYNVPGYPTMSSVPNIDNGYLNSLRFGGVPRNMLLERNAKNYLRQIFPRTTIGLNDPSEYQMLRNRKKLNKNAHRDNSLKHRTNFIEIKFTPNGPILRRKPRHHNRMRKNFYRMLKLMMNKFASNYFKGLRRRSYSQKVIYPQIKQRDVRLMLNFLQELLKRQRVIYLNPKIINRIYLPPSFKKTPRFVSTTYQQPYIPQRMSYAPQRIPYVPQRMPYVPQPNLYASYPRAKKGQNQNIDDRLVNILNKFMIKFMQNNKPEGIKISKNKKIDKKHQKKPRSFDKRLKRIEKKLKKMEKTSKKNVKMSKKKSKKAKISKKYRKKIKILKLLIKKGIIIPLQGSTSSIKRYLKIIDKRLYTIIKPTKKSKSKKYIVYSKYSMPLNRLTYKLMKYIKPRYKMLVIPKINIASKKKYRYTNFKKSEWESFSKLLRQISGLMRFDPYLALKYSKPLISFLNRYHHNLNDDYSSPYSYSNPLFHGFKGLYPDSPDDQIEAGDNRDPQIYHHLMTDHLLGQYLNNIHRSLYSDSLTPIPPQINNIPHHTLNSVPNSQSGFSTISRPFNHFNPNSVDYEDPLSRFPNDLLRINSVPQPSVHRMLSTMGQEDVDAYLKQLQQRYRAM